MKKSFPLEAPGLQAPRVIEMIKRDVGRYLKRERRKKLPEGVDFWDFDCRAGQESGNAEICHVSALTTAIDAAAEQGWKAIYLEILSKPGHRTKKEPSPREED